MHQNEASKQHLFAEKTTDFIIRFRLAIILFTFLFVVTAASGLRFLTFTNDSRIYFSKENPQLQALEALENTYSREDNIFIALAPEQGSVFSIPVLKAVAELTEACWQIPFSYRVDSLTNFQFTEADHDDLIVRDLVPDPDSLKTEDLQQIADAALGEPQLVNRLLSADGKVTAVNILVVKPGKNRDETARATAYARQLIATFTQKYPAIDFHLTGGIIIDNVFGEASKMDMQTLVPGMYVVLLLILALSLRSAISTFATFLVILFSMLTGMGLFGWSMRPLNPTTVNAPTIILTLAVADSIHILITMLQKMRTGEGKSEAIRESLAINLKPVILTSVTTAIGFLSMNFSDAPPFRELGNIVAMGILSALFYSIFFLPAMISVLPVGFSKQPPGKKHRLCDSIAEFVIRRKKTLLWSMIAAIALGSIGIRKIELNDDFVEYFDHRYAFRRATDFVQKNLTGFNVIEYSLAAEGSGGIHDPRYLKTVEEFANWYRTQPKVSHVSAITDIMKRLNKSMHNDDPAWYRIPDNRELAAQYLLLYEMSLPFGLDLNSAINVDKSSSRMTVRLRNISSAELRAIDDRAREWLRGNAPPSMFTYGTGLSIMFAHISERNINSMLVASFGALFLISLILIFALRSLKMGIISLLPNLSPALLSFGLWGLLVGRVGLVISVLAALTLGIVVDDTIHFLSKYLHARRQLHLSPQDSVRYAFHTVGTAMWVTTLVLVCGFMVLTLSGFQLNSQMGLVTAVTIIIALVMDFLFLPALLLACDKEKRNQSPGKEQAEIIEKIL